MSFSIDIETLATTDNAVILSIGACNFSTKNGEIKSSFQVNVNSELQHSRYNCPDTLAWWNKQSPEARKAAFNGTTRLREALEQLSEYIGMNSRERVWARGCRFDFGILKNAYVSYGMETPWKFWNEMELRTIEYIASRKGVKYYPKPEEGLYHIAVEDAIHQAKSIHYYHKELGL